MNSMCGALIIVSYNEACYAIETCSTHGLEMTSA